jgi:osmotically-inducible protein OsmY
MKYFIILSLSMFLLSCSSTKERESFGEYVDNSAISTKVKSKLLSTSKVSSTSIDVESYKGVVILSGFVSSEEEKEKALDVAKNTKGVRMVKDALFVKGALSE